MCILGAFTLKNAPFLRRCISKHRFALHVHSSLSVPAAGISTLHKFFMCRLPGFIGPIPQPLLIRHIALFHYKRKTCACQRLFTRYNSAPGISRYIFKVNIGRRVRCNFRRYTHEKHHSSAVRHLIFHYLYELSVCHFV